MYIYIYIYIYIKCISLSSCAPTQPSPLTSNPPFSPTNSQWLTELADTSKLTHRKTHEIPTCFPDPWGEDSSQLESHGPETDRAQEMPKTHAGRGREPLMQFFLILCSFSVQIRKPNSNSYADNFLTSFMIMINIVMCIIIQFPCLYYYYYSYTILFHIS